MLVLIVREKRSCEDPGVLQECSRHLPVRKERVIMVSACLFVCVEWGSIRSTYSVCAGHEGMM